MKDKVFLIDGNSLANRAYYAMPYFTTSNGTPSGAVFGFVNIILKIITEEKPSGILVAFDHSRKTFRNELYSEYKGTRKETAPELIQQFPAIKKILEAMNIKIFEQEGIEADDIIGTACSNLDCDKVILSGDRDLLQLTSSNTQIWLTVKGVSVLNKIDLSELKKQFSITPSQVVDIKALMGDSSDNIPGVSGIGEKTALKLIGEFGYLDSVYANIDKIPGKLREKLVENKEMAYLSYQLATIKKDCTLNGDLTDLSYDFPFNENVKKIFEEYSFSSLTKKKELFKYNQDSLEKNKVIIDNLEKVDALVNNVKDFFAYDLAKMEFSVKPGEIFCVNKSFDMFSQALTLSDILFKLKQVFEDKNILKLTISAKEDMHKLSSLNINLDGYFDLTLADYLNSTGMPLQPITKNCDEWFELYKSLINKLDEQNLTELYYNLELPLSKVLFNMEKSGFKIDASRLNKIDELFTAKLVELTKSIYEQAGEEFNVNSPKQVSNILFDKLGLSSFQNKKRSTRVEILDDLKYSHPIVELIIDYRKYQKIKSTYIDVYKRICNESGNIIHTSFNQSLTNTGRISSSDPNLQNIPTRDDIAKSLREIFISKFEGGLLASADYNQIELRLLADMSQEEKLIEIYNQGLDIHTATACEIFGVAPNEVTQKMRREAKAVNFGVIYGISDYGLSQNIKISRKNAGEFIKSYFIKYPKVKSFADNNIAFAKKNGFIKTKFGRIRHIPELSSSNFNVRAFGERVAMNMPLQGTASDIIKFSMLKVERLLDEYKMKSQLILQIHDELVIDVYPGEKDKVEQILHEAMENWVHLSVPLSITLNFGKNLAECK